MKESNLTFMEGFTTDLPKIARANNSPHKSFDWNKAAEIIKQNIIEHPDLIAEAGLNGDWDYTGGIIYQNGKPDYEDYTYLSSNWAMPTLIISWGGVEQIEIQCYVLGTDVFDSHSKWPESSLEILNKQ